MKERKQILIRITDELHQKLKTEASRKGIPVNALIVNILWERMSGKGPLGK